jgi:zinc transporter 1/2/3
MLFVVIAIVALIAVGLIGGLLPLRISAYTPGGAKFLAMGNIFAGGIFLGGGVMHLLPESVEIFEGIESRFEYPYAFLLAILGFMVVLFLENVVVGGHDVGTTTMSMGRQNFAYVLTVVLSVHSIITGIALGLEPEAGSSIVILVAILVHKGFAAFALGISLKVVRFPRKKLIGVVALFSSMTPLGIVIGTVAISLLGSAAETATGVFSALAGGTFLYVAAMEIIDEAFHTGGEYGQKFSWMMAGFAVMAVLAVWA